MRETLVTFKVAKLAKEKGFDWGCYWYYTYKRKLPTNKQTFYPSIGTGELENFNDKDMIGDFYERISAPSQPILQKWLREKHLIISIRPYWTRRGSINYTASIFDMNPTIALSKKGFTNYEEALEVGLQEALNLI